MRLRQYLPDFVGNIKEFKELDRALSPELDSVDERVRTILANQFIETATEEGLSRYEKMLHIQSVSDVDVRRFNILTKFNSRIPFTMRWLQNTLNTTIGKDLYLIDLQPHKYTLTISIMKSKEYLIDNVKKELRTKIPANMILEVNVLQPIDVDLFTSAYIHTADIYNI